jgi:hypothetical protein
MRRPYVPDFKIVCNLCYSELSHQLYADIASGYLPFPALPAYRPSDDNAQQLS